jgi:hypothetical protein
MFLAGRFSIYSFSEKNTIFDIELVKISQHCCMKGNVVIWEVFFLGWNSCPDLRKPIANVPIPALLSSNVKL